ncbi:MAG TPA: 1-acyl-sn-glycerol-3-phosphate acyltransferase [Lentisphaeria bacterium]|nr:MAG: hypothetical protein A2X47_09550 [Lentisphaerae bacterium GWF2_38_69]HBM17084.1 1-acyl-sn-glycerol-3-phosphate acyltransferase [Lentisphaeria bacterium]
MNYTYQGDSYDTPVDAPKAIGDTLLFKRRLYFYYRFFSVIYKANSVIKKKGQYTNEDWAENSYYTFRSVENCGGKIHIKGMSNIIKIKEPVVFIGNHMSTLETFLIPGILCPRKPSSFVVKKELVDSKIFGLIMKSTSPIVVGRSNPMEDLKTVLNEGTEKLKTGRSMIVFPQHTRSAVFKPDDFNSIGVKLAKKAGAKIIPFALKTDFMENGKHFKDLGPIRRERDVYIEFAEPMDVEGNGKETHNKIVEFVKKKLLGWGGTVAQ